MRSRKNRTLMGSSAALPQLMRTIGSVAGGAAVRLL